MNIKTFIRSAAAVLTAFGCAAAMASAADVTRIIVPFPPGGGGDTLARSVVDKFEEALGTSVVVDNRPGAGGSVGTSQLVRSRPDGRTIGYVTNGILCVNEHLYPMTFSPEKDLVPVAGLSRIGLVVALNPNVIKGVTDLKSLIAYAKAHPGEVDFASAGNGTTSHLAGLLFEKAAGVKLTHIPHKGGAPAMMNVLGGHIPLMIDVSPNVLKHLDSGKIVALGTTGRERLAAAPSIPTMSEQGYPGMVISAWDGFVVPKGTPAEKVDQLNRAFVKALKDPVVVERLHVKAAEAMPMSSDEFAAFISGERPRWKALAESVGIKGS